jgi:uncharacterized protein YodC (DUF2158 family)
MELEKTVSRTFNEYPDYEVGDLVRLRSGGPLMTVDTVGGSRITCVWFDGIAGSGSHQYHMRTFDQGAIEKVTKDPDLSPA